MSYAVDLYPTKYCSTDNGNPDSNITNGGYLMVGAHTGRGESGTPYVLSVGYCDTWLSFDLTSIPVGSTIIYTRLNFFISDEFNTDYSSILYSLYDVSPTSWDTSTITWNNAPNANIIGSAGSMWLGINYGSGFYTWKNFDINYTNLQNSLSSGEITYKFISDNTIGSILVNGNGDIYLTIYYEIPTGPTILPTSNISTDQIRSVLGLTGPTTFQDICQSNNVQSTGLNATYCPGATAALRLTNLQTAPFEIAKFRGYTHT